MDSLSQFKEILNKSGSFLLIAHEEPDGDCLGSILALNEALIGIGKKVKMVCKDQIPQVFQFLDGIEAVKTDFLIGDHDAVVFLDNGDTRRTGFPLRLLKLKGKVSTVNIDHHPKNDLWRLAKINLADETASSTSEIVFKLISDLGLNITPKMATYLLTGIFTDTGGFRHTNTSNKVLEIVSTLLKKGGRLGKVSENIANSHPISTLRLWGIALDRLFRNKDLGIIYSVLKKEDIELAGATEEEVSGLITLINSTPDSRISLLLYETRDGKIKGSLRTEKDGSDVSILARALGGGGHKKASGFTIEGKLEKVDQQWQII